MLNCPGSGYTRVVPNARKRSATAGQMRLSLGISECHAAQRCKRKENGVLGHWQCGDLRCQRYTLIVRAAIIS